MVAFDDGEMHLVDTIEYQGQFWLVSSWNESRQGRWSKPVRIVSLATIPHQMSSGGGEPRGVVNYPIPKVLLQDVHALSPELAARYRVVDSPDITLPYLPELS